MSIIKDGNVYRTEYEQLVHLTEKHLEQVTINQNVNRQLQELSVSSNLGGYNFVRFAFQKQGVFYRLADKLIYNSIPSSDVNDYFEISSGIIGDIPAYGYLDENGYVNISFFGDLVSMYQNLNMRNVTKNISVQIQVNYEEFDGTGLLDYSPQDKKKQLFNVINDLEYNAKTQYASFDLNNDGIYNYVFVGVVINGKDGSSIFSVSENSINFIQTLLSFGDQILITFNGSYLGMELFIGDILEFVSENNFIKKGNIRGPEGKKGETGVQGEQGIQGVQGEQGVQGVQGLQGEKGQNAPILNLVSYLDNQSFLPPFNIAEEQDAYVVLNTSGATISYDLYFKGKGATQWQIIPNFGPLKGETGAQGPRGQQGIQGVQGQQGERGPVGGVGPLYTHTVIMKGTKYNKPFYASLNIINADSTRYTKENFYNAFNKFGANVAYPSNGYVSNTISSGQVFLEEILWIDFLRETQETRDIIIKVRAIRTSNDKKTFNIDYDFPQYTLFGSDLTFTDYVSEVIGQQI